MTELTLAISAIDHKAIQTHLFPGDGLEAAAILICGRAGKTGQRLCVRSVILIPYHACSVRTQVRLSWPGEYLELAIDKADAIGGSIILAHSHPGGLFHFSNLDDESDRITIPCIRHGSVDETIPHGSAIMVPNGSMKARLYTDGVAPDEVNKIWRIGANIEEISGRGKTPVVPFSSDMTAFAKTLSACVIGASGTGSPTIEMLTRMGFGSVVQVDFDKMEPRNLNRILNSTHADAQAGALKVDVMERAAKAHRPDINILSITTPISDDAAIIAASGCDIIFCCVDTMEGRLYCDLIAEACLIPLIDIGVMIPTRKGHGGAEIADVVARIDYVYPGGATLRDRSVITGEGLAAEDILRTDPQTYAQHLKEGYIHGVVDEAPSVIALNMHASSLAVMELIARLLPFRHEENEAHDRIFLSLGSRETDYELSAPPMARGVNSIYGQGLKYPLLGMVARLQKTKDAA